MVRLKLMQYALRRDSSCWDRGRASGPMPSRAGDLSGALGVAGGQFQFPGGGAQWLSGARSHVLSLS